MDLNRFKIGNGISDLAPGGCFDEYFHRRFDLIFDCFSFDFVSVLDLKKLGSDWLIVIGRMLMEAALDPDGLLFLLGSVVVVVVVVAVVAAAGAVVGFCLFPD